MSDQYDACLTAYKAQLLTLASTFFPSSTGRAAGWQISENDTTPMEGGDYFITLRPGAFSQERRGEFQDNVWGVTTILYYRYSEYATLWTNYKVFRSAILGLPDTKPLKTVGIRNQVFISNENAGYLLDGQGNYTNFVVQSLNCAITQRVLIRRAF